MLFIWSTPAARNKRVRMRWYSAAYVHRPIPLHRLECFSLPALQSTTVTASLGSNLPGGKLNFCVSFLLLLLAVPRVNFSLLLVRRASEKLEIRAGG